MEKCVEDGKILNNEITGNFNGVAAGAYQGGGSAPDAGLKEGLYRFGKYWSSPGGSDNRFMEVRNAGPDNEIAYNDMHDAQAGLQLNNGSGSAPLRSLLVHDNQIRNTVGTALLVWDNLVEVEIYDNLVYDGNINMRFHHADEQNSSYRVYIYRNKYYMPGNRGTHIWTHFSSSGNAPGRYFIYHNSFAGPSQKGVSFNASADNGLPNSVWLNNIFSLADLAGGNNAIYSSASKIGVYDYNWLGGTWSGSAPPWAGSNNVAAHGQKYWADTTMPDFSPLSKLSSAPEGRDKGLNLAGSLNLVGQSFSQGLPGMVAGYGGTDNKPDLGAIQSQ